MKKISIGDITLKKLWQNRDVSLLFREKTAIAVCADSIGADSVELAPVKNVVEDTIICKTIASKVTNSVLCIPTGFTEEDVLNAWECIKEAKHPRLQVELPISTVQMEYMYHMKSDKMLERISQLVKKAKELCDDVEFCALDATRCDIDFLISAIKEAEANGAKIVTLCDDAGVSVPEEIAKMVETVKGETNSKVYVQVSDRTNMAVATAIASIKSGADGLKCAMAGDGVLLTGEIADTLSICEKAVDAETNLKNTKIHTSIEDMLSRVNSEAYSKEEKIESKSEILLDADSSIVQVAKAAGVLGYDLSDEQLGNVHKALLQVLENKGTVGAKEFEALIASSAIQAPSTYHLENYTTNSSSLTSSMSQVTLRRGDEMLLGVSTGDGPIDSVFRAIEQSIGHHYELDDFQVQAITEGKDALGSALVKLRNNGKLYSGTGISTDIVAASVRAYINALNKIAFEEE